MNFTQSIYFSNNVQGRLLFDEKLKASEAFFENSKLKVIRRSGKVNNKIRKRFIIDKNYT